MRGWIMAWRCYLQLEPPLAAPLERGRAGLGARRHDLSSDDRLQLVDGSLQPVVDDRVGELVGELALLERLGEPFFDLALAFRATGPQPPLELLAVRRRDEDGHAARNSVANRQRAPGLELE